MNLDLRVINDTNDPSALESTFHEYWDAYKKWIDKAPPRSAEECAKRIQDHAPSIIPVYAQLLDRLDASEEQARFLSLYDPPRVVRGCTQLVHDTDRGPRLLRAYDHHPNLFDGVILDAKFSLTRTLALTDCLWGALDGINEHGLAIALAFGGRPSIGPGFAAQLVCRAVLESCATTREARDVLERIPVYMPYTFVVLDAQGDFITAFLSPDRSPTFITRRASTNHQSASEWSAYTKFTESEARLERAQQLIEHKPTEEPIDAFLEPPIWRTNYDRASGTLYVAEYAPIDRTLTMRWPTLERRFTLGETTAESFTAQLPKRTAASK